MRRYLPSHRSNYSPFLLCQVLVFLTAAHWKVIEFCRKEGMTSGKAPTLRQITSGAGVTTKEMFALFPKGPAKKVAHISGLGKPEGCV